MPRRFQFSLRALLVITTAICVWLGWWVESIRRQDEVLKTIRAMGGEASYSETPNVDFPWLADYPWWITFRQYSFVKPDGTVVWAHKVGDLRGEEIHNDPPIVTLTDDGLGQVAALEGLGALSIMAVPITDDGLKRLHNAKGLRFLMLSRTDITASGVAELRKALPKCNIVARFGRNRFGRGPLSN